MLITRPNHDLTTNYLYYWSSEIISQANKKGVRVTDLSKTRANINEFTSVVKKTRPMLIVLNGHGNDSMVTGYRDNPLVEVNKNHDLLNGAVVYARSCRSAKKLGKVAVKSGCKAYIGYDDDFVFVIDDTNVTRPLSDKTARLFMEPSNQVATSLLKGHDPEESNRRSLEVYKKIIQKLMASNSSKEDIELIPHLAWDYSHQVCL